MDRAPLDEYLLALPPRHNAVWRRERDAAKARGEDKATAELLAWNAIGLSAVPVKGRPVPVADILGVALTKGDLPGHPFRGNQWTEGAGGAWGEGDKSDSDIEEEEKYVREVMTERALNPETYSDFKDGAVMLRSEAKRLTDPKRKAAYERAAELQETAATASADYETASMADPDEVKPETVAAHEAADATRRAAVTATEAAIRWAQKAKETRERNTKASAQAKVDAAVKEFGFKGKVIVTLDEHEFTVAGQRAKAVGTASSTREEITLHARQMRGMPTDEVREVVAHEIAHVEFHRGGGQRVVSSLERFGTRESLAKEGAAVSEYAASWWKHYEKAKARGGAMRDPIFDPVNETFAEIRGMVRTGKKLKDVCSPAWQRIYREVVKVAGMRTVRVTKGDLPGHAFRGNQWTEGVAAARAAVEEVCAATGFPSSRIDVVDDPPETITFDGLPNSVAGVFNAKKDGRITIYPRATDEMHRKYPDWNVRGVIAHEIAHAQYSAAWEADPVAMSKLERGWEKLAPGGGTISPYAKAFWDDVTYWRGRSTVVHSAISETLSEIHRIVMGGDPLAKAAPPEWRKAYRTVQRLAATVRKGDFDGHPFRGNQYTDGASGGGQDFDGEAQEREEARIFALGASNSDEHQRAVGYFASLAHWARDHGDAEAARECLAAGAAHERAQWAARAAEKSQRWLEDMGTGASEESLADQQRETTARNADYETIRQWAVDASEIAFKAVDRVDAKLEEESARREAVRETDEWKSTKSKVEALTKEFGYTGEVELTDETYHVSLMGQEFNAAGSASFNESGHIKIYVREWGAIGDDYARTVVAHEIGHMEFTAATAEMGEEGDRIQESVAPEYRDAIREAEAKGIEGDARFEYAQEHAIMRADGTLTARGRREFPLHAQQEALGKAGDIDALAEEDGVTPYSTRWWNAYKAREATTEQALHETFAEIRALERAGKRVEDVAKPSWVAYYKLMVKAGTDRLKRQGKEA
jgi:predicted SprT family Zn-dependent metalloprotease